MPQSSLYSTMIMLGMLVATGQPLQMQLASMMRYFLITGIQGSGKSVLISNITDQIIPHVQCHVFQFKDREANQLYEHHENLWAIPWDRERWNPFDIHWVTGNPTYFINDLIDFICEFFHAHASRKYLKEAVYNCYDKNGAFNNRLLSPTVSEVIFECKRLYGSTNRESRGYANLIINQLESLHQTFQWRIDVRVGFDYPRDHSIIYGLFGLNYAEQNFRMVCSWLRLYHTAQSFVPSQRYPVALITDEIDRLFDRAYEISKKDFGRLVVASLLERIRSSLITIIASVRRPSTTMTALLAETYNKVFFNLELYQDRLEMSKSMNISPEQMIEIPSLLSEPYRFIFKTGHVAQSVLVKSNPPRVTQGEYFTKLLDQKMDCVIPRLEYIPAEPIMKITPSADISSREDKKSQDISENAKKLFFAVITRPTYTLSQLYKIAGFSSLSAGHKAKEELVKASYIIEHKIQAGRNKVVFLEPTERGCSTFSVQKPRLKGKAGWLHTVAQYLLKEALEK